MISVRFVVVYVAVVLVGAVGSVQAVPDRLLEATPQNAVAALYLDGGDAGTPSATPAEMLIATIGRLREMGLFKTTSRTPKMFLDALQGWSMIHRYPRAYVLHDVRLRPLPTNSSRLDGLALSLILQTGDDDLKVRQLIQQFLARYTNDQTARLEAIDLLGRPFHRLTDSSLPDWAVWDWGRVDDLFIISIGEGSTEKILQTLSNEPAPLLTDEWFAPAHHHAGGESAAVELFLRADELQARLGDAAADRVYDIFDGLGLQSYEQSLWTIGLRDRAVTCSAYHRQGGADRLAYIAQARQDQAEYEKLIPAGATWYAIINQDAAAVFRSLRLCFLASYRLEKRLKLFEGWDELTENRPIDVEAELLSHLGDHIILHNYPPHSLGLPMMCTILVEIKGDARRVQRALSAILDSCALKLDLAAAKRLTPALAPALRQADDGVWYLQYGIYGPAVAVTNGWLAISYSPDALRANLAAPLPPAVQDASAPTPAAPTQPTPADADIVPPTTQPATKPGAGREAFRSGGNG